MNGIECHPLSGLSTSELLADIFTELLGPIAIVGRDRHIVFRSRSFEEIVGKPIHGGKLSCDLLILPGVTSCCMDAIDSYPEDTRAGIWNVRRAGGAAIPVLARWQPVKVGSHLALLAIQFTSIEAPASSPAVSLFRGIRHSARDETAYMVRTAEYLRQSLNCAAVAWFDLSGGARPVLTRGMDAATASILQTDAAAARCRMQDALLPAPGGRQVFHVFSCSDGGRKVCLSVGGLEDGLDRSLVDALQAALAATFDVDSGEAQTVESDADYQSALEVMTPAEADILGKLLIGMSNKEIAAERGVSPHTVKNQVKRVLKKAGVHRRVDLLRRFRTATINGR